MLGKNQRSPRPQMKHVQLKQQYSLVARLRTSVGFKLAVRTYVVTLEQMAW